MGRDEAVESRLPLLKGWRLASGFGCLRWHQGNSLQRFGEVDLVIEDSISFGLQSLQCSGVLADVNIPISEALCALDVVFRYEIFCSAARVPCVHVETTHISCLWSILQKFDHLICYDLSLVIGHQALSLTRSFQLYSPVVLESILCNTLILATHSRTWLVLVLD